MILLVLVVVFVFDVRLLVRLLLALGLLLLPPPLPLLIGPFRTNELVNRPLSDGTYGCSSGCRFMRLSVFLLFVVGGGRSMLLCYSHGPFPFS